MSGSFRRGVLIGRTLFGRRAKGAGDPAVVPRRENVWSRAEQAQEVIAGVRVQAWVSERDRVVGVPVFFAPRLEDRFVERVVGTKRCDHAFGRIVKEDGADAREPVEFKVVRRGEERFVLADRLAFVVVDGPAAAHPTRRNIGAYPRDSTWLGLRFELCLTTEPIPITKGVMKARRSAEKIRNVSFSTQRVDHKRLGRGRSPRAEVRELIGDDARGRIA